MSNGTEGRDVLSSLPRSRPQRRSAKRNGSAAKPRTRPRAAATTPRKAAPTKPKAKVRDATRPSAATVRARQERAAGRKPPRPAPAPPDRDLVTTALEAAGELARMGLTVGTQLVREATRRIPRP
jgi:hypothetical protein